MLSEQLEQIQWKRQNNRSSVLRGRTFWSKASKHALKRRFKSTFFKVIQPNLFCFPGSLLPAVRNNQIHPPVQTLGWILTARFSLWIEKSSHCLLKLTSGSLHFSLSFFFSRASKRWRFVHEVRQGKSSWRAAARRQPLRSSLITSGCKQQHSSPSSETSYQQRVNISVRGHRGLLLSAPSCMKWDHSAGQEDAFVLVVDPWEPDDENKQRKFKVQWLSGGQELNFCSLEDLSVLMCKKFGLVPLVKRQRSTWNIWGNPQSEI